MKKLKLNVDDLSVTSFVAREDGDGRGTVNGAQISWYMFSGCAHCAESFVETQCGLNCTQADGCYPSYYCSDIGPGMPNNSCGDGCMTNANGAC
ncbi:MAG TPA: hypothetical protein VM759_13160 [Longimicrobium sp.]|nr:hypothetical protein [Longimicrobium sp.]